MYCQTEGQRYHTVTGSDSQLSCHRENLAQGRQGEGETADKGDYSVERKT